jgi:hypothetical protein
MVLALTDSKLTVDSFATPPELPSPAITAHYNADGSALQPGGPQLDILQNDPQ